MRESLFRLKRKAKNPLYSWLSIVVLAVLAVILAKGAFGMMEKEKESARRLEGSRQMVAALEGRETELKQNVEFLGTEEGIEAEIRDKFGVSREGEQVALVIESGEPATSSEPEEEGWFSRLWNAIRY